MDSYEVQAKSRLGWQILGAFDEYESAQACALELEYDGAYDELRVTREIEDSRSGRFRATVLFRCGQKVREAAAREEAENDRQSAYERRQQRLKRVIMPRWIRKSDRERVRREAMNVPLRLAMWTALLFAAGLAALYYVQFVLFGK
jgi:hypothetical protein